MLCPLAPCPLLAGVSFGREGLLLAAAGLLLVAAVCAGLLRRGRGFGRAGAGRVAALSAVAVLLGALASIGPALGAPRGFPLAAADPWIFAALFALGWFPVRRARCWWWGGLAAGLAAGAAAIPLLPASPGLAGVEDVNRGAEVEVAWSASGARVRLVDPLDPPLLYVNGEPRDLERERIARLRPVSRRRCPDAAGERQAAWNAFLSANPDAAIARGRLALTICRQDVFARALVGEALLRRGVAELRCGRLAEARRDIEQASRLLDSPAALGRARRAGSLIDEANPDH
ncbi:MAG: hypothetical protein R6V85_14255 [Polyangia bacterium]